MLKTKTERSKAGVEPHLRLTARRQLIECRCCQARCCYSGSQEANGLTWRSLIGKIWESLVPIWHNCYNS
ncbi:hypothetical protein H6G94_29705 [Nostoc punctiforme FACHB-252]|uniref:Uncharacterized protein n=1 Tax=Nostoc punctiforme FACHB-252 TaxID=1357509 RepID=A0ABR8HIL6_NOSPU|nr:hypothetical protein [Nostoc punctiforme]MBD2615377.1 hypothetical protein [Nostoc punctiforme FACHB-252]